ncbi:uncharacterized protein [Salmo salar]|uniref:Apoptosis facilitator Bcl-2-like protein 14 n=1 Tax=Salmo salar TaxID=8030 RepID=A0A1S3P1T8_SALSA|nr:uncharacterized protein LOC106582722 [Salmo salar]
MPYCKDLYLTKTTRRNQHIYREGNARQTVCKKVSVMEVTEKVMPKNAQLLSLGHKDTCRLLEVYVKRSISLNDGTCVGLRSPTKPQKWVTLSEKCTRVRRHSSDTLINLGPSTPDEGIASSTPPDEEVVIPNVSLVEIPGPADIPEIETSTELENKSKKGKKKSKQTSFWKGFLGFFSTKGSDKKDEQESGTEKDGQSQGTLQKKTSIRQRSSMRRLSLRKIKIDSHRGSVKRPLALDRAKTTDITGVESVLSVGPTDSYYEKVSEELEKIVHEVKERETALTDEDVIKRIIVLMKQQGDLIDNKLKENPSLSSFFQKLSYSTFQQLADTYVETETPTGQSRQTPHTAGSGHDNAPELVKLAFTLDFTARVAFLSRHSKGHIMGLGHRYLEDRFTQTQVNPDQTLHNYDDHNH